MLLKEQVHDHCVACYSTNCNYAECPVISCSNCFSKLHGCKVDDHLLICLKAIGPCINHCYGCTATVQRGRMSLHLRFCPANVVSCTYHWCRKYLSAEAERKFKAIVKSLSSNLPVQSTHEMDIAPVLIDQNVSLETMRRKRLKRIRARKTDTDPIDSSDEERMRKEYARNNPFAGCYLCRQNPGSQHLHVLGNLTSRIRPAAAIEKSPTNEANMSCDNFHGLYMELDHFCLDGTRLAQRTHSLNVCRRVVHREQAADHWYYHAAVHAALPGFIVRRCPMFENGCHFSTAGLVPIRGVLKFNEFLGCVTHVPCSDVLHSVADCTAQIISAVGLLSDYLDGAAVVCLAATNSQIRRRIFTCFSANRTLDARWCRQADGRWAIGEYRRSFGAVQAPVKLIVQPLATLSEHLSVCEFNITKSFYGIKKVELPYP